MAGKIYIPSAAAAAAPAVASASVSPRSSASVILVSVTSFGGREWTDGRKERGGRREGRQMHDNCGGHLARRNAVLNRVTERMDMAWDGQPCS